jgi:isopenicillin N synthase-like dioxygenase
MGLFLHQGPSDQRRTHRRRARQRQRFFAQPAAEKLKIDITQTRHHRGYGAIATEQLDPSKPSDLKETFDMGLHLPADHPEVLAEKPCAGRIAIRQCQAGKR